MGKTITEGTRVLRKESARHLRTTLNVALPVARVLLKCVIRFSISVHWYAFPNFCTNILVHLRTVYASPQKLVWPLISYLNSDECASRKASLLSSSSITSMACLGTVSSATLSRNFSPTASLSSFSSPSSLLMILSCSCRRYFFCCLLTFSSTWKKRIRTCYWARIRTRREKDWRVTCEDVWIKKDTVGKGEG